VGNFSWNLGTDDADLSNPRVNDTTALVESPVAMNASTAVTVPAPASGPVADSAPMSRRELRNRAAAAPSAIAPTFETTALETAVRKGKVKSTKAPRAPRGRSPRVAAAIAAGRPPRKRGSRRTFFSKLFSVGAMLGVGAIMISTSIPANAFYSSTDATHESMSSVSSNAQSMKVASTAVDAAPTRDTYTVSSLAEQLRLKYGSRIYSYTNDVNGTIQWPFPIPVPISSGFGPRIAPCGGCSSMHEGVDFTPGRGVAIGAIADGVVSAVIASHAGLGNHVIVDHVINGQKVQSVYGHMLDNSFAVAVGDQVKVAQKLGEVGSTGESTGAHLHLEIHINGVPVDPFAWLKANAN